LRIHYTYTFSGLQRSNPFSIQIVAHSEIRARIIAYSAIIDAYANNGKSLRYPMDINIGNYCNDITEFLTPIFHSPIENKYVDFNEWIKIAQCSVRPFNAFEIRIYSCLDG
jgi:hypothetical protein